MTHSFGVYAKAFIQFRQTLGQPERIPHGLVQPPCVNLKTLALGQRRAIDEALRELLIIENPEDLELQRAGYGAGNYEVDVHRFS